MSIKIPLQQIQIYDTTLRDGTQSEGFTLSGNDKVRVAQKLDDLGVAFIEGGWPGSNPKGRRVLRTRPRHAMEEPR
jgi:2-isopropylmalate synthase